MVGPRFPELFLVGGPAAGPWPASIHARAYSMSTCTGGSMPTSKTTGGPRAMPCLVSTSEATCLLSVEMVSAPSSPGGRAGITRRARSTSGAGLRLGLDNYALAAPMPRHSWSLAPGIQMSETETNRAAGVVIDSCPSPPSRGGGIEQQLCQGPAP